MRTFIPTAAPTAPRPRAESLDPDADAPVRTSSAPNPPDDQSAPGILLVEDEDAVRALTARLLSREGYRMYVASTADEAISIFARWGDQIDLLVTDLVLPGIDGQQLADRLLERKPGLAVVYTSGYPWEAMIPEGGLPRGRAFLAKPYGARELSAVVRETLDASSPEPTAPHEVTTAAETRHAHER